LDDRHDDRLDRHDDERPHHTMTGGRSQTSLPTKPDVHS
jgi:hypothetical protein